jgi:3-dehydroquinate synthase class II
LTPITEVANHGAINPTKYKIIVGGEHFTLNLNQDQFTESEKTKINAIKKHFETSSNLNIILPKTTYDDNNDDILNAIKLKLENDIESISSSDYHLINRKDSTIVEVAIHNQPSTQYIIVVGKDEFTLNLNQEQFSESEKIKINVIKKHFETSSNLNLILPKTIYSNDNSVLAAIKLKLINDINDITNDDSHLIVKKVGSVAVTLVATHSQPPAQYIIVVGKDEFTLNLNQDQFTEEEKTKINAIKKHFETSSNLNLILPQTTYSNNNDILNVIKLKLINDIEDISSGDSYLINRKDSTIDEVALHSEPPTQYIIVVGEDEFILNLNQDQFTESEKIKISAIEKHFETLGNLNLILPQTTYSDDNSILEAIKLKLENNIEDISSFDSYLITKKAGSVVVTSVATHSQPPTQYIITIGEEDFILQIKQDQFTKEEKTKIFNFKILLKTINNLGISLPKDTGSDYDEDSKILIAIRKFFVDQIS